MTVRIEQDLLGPREVPGAAYWGIHTLRARENFAISGRVIGEEGDLIHALAAIKLAAAEANRDLGLLQGPHAAAIIAACREIMAGALRDQFLVDQMQGGAGTSTNMNANEVIANRALELMGRTKGDYAHLHPNEHVNLGQSTNDVYPTALRLATWTAIGRLLTAMADLRQAFAAKAAEFSDILKMGRTQLQEAVPMTLGQEFGAFATMLAEDEARLCEARALLCEINLGATAVGTGLTAHPDYAARARARLEALTGIPLINAPDLIEATQDCGVFVQVSGVLKRVAVKLSKTCNDLRLLSSGPRAGLNEINLPARQAGSSIMPGKVNPVIPEVVNQIAFGVIGNDITITMAAEAGQLQLNAFEPVIACTISRSIRHLTAGCETLRAHCITGITANRAALAQSVTQSIGIVTALNPYIGYENATELAREAFASGRGVCELALERGLLPEALLATILSPEHLTRPSRPLISPQVRGG
ncbi:aspartate ammonia-lyase [Rhodobacter sp. 24-YEA-8]|uniref:aspartate ammonia-lyase n=1 Tax=Rhodobacter sp. 24-YEA-8 TaxID=1884310 RepID=UPI00089D7084|nr:aspartate ammonia-lyase [Rhodobacter sp. 24-YEA-8]SEC21030.1 aspartate ammonia-lyase [Rhodobacter sp. 24-YEA-8]